MVDGFSFEVLDLDECRAILIDILHPGGPCCPYCGSKDLTETQRQTFTRFGRVRCSDCGRWFRASTGTILQGSYLDPRQVVLIAVGCAHEISNTRLADLVGVSTQTVRKWRDRLN